MTEPNFRESQGRSRMRKALVTTLILVPILLLGGFFRYFALNWDDFAGLHPDERFLTMNLLPLVGGALEFTPDQSEFPNQLLMVSSSDSANYTLATFETDTRLAIGAFADQPGAQLAVWWLRDPNRVRTFNSSEDALRALLAREIQGFIVPESGGEFLSADLQPIATFRSEDFQRIRCQALYPNSNGIGGYFDARCSNLNPHNSAAGFYAYGTLPLFMAHFAGQFVQSQAAAGSPIFDYQNVTLVWRWLSAFFDVGTVLMVFFIGSRMHNRWVGLLAALLYATAPLAIQKAHFGTVNAISAFFVALALYAAVAVQDRGRLIYYALFGFAFGAALAGRINLAPLAGVILLAGGVQALTASDHSVPWRLRRTSLLKTFLGIFIAGAASLLTFRILNPYAFTGPGFFEILPNARWFADLASGSFGVSGAMDSPPNWQWLNRPAYLFPLKDIVLWGLGIGAGLLACFGTLWSVWRMLRARPGALRNLIIVAWLIVYFAYMGRVWVMTMRYYLPLYSSLAIIAAWALWEIWKLARQPGREPLSARLLLVIFAAILGAIPAFHIINSIPLNATALAAFGLGLTLMVAAILPGLRHIRPVILVAFVAGFTVLWGAMFTNGIYGQQSARIQAANWLRTSIPGDFALAIDGAPDGTPLINLGLMNSRAESSTSPDALFTAATRLETQVPQYIDFTVPATGPVYEIFAPHLGDPFNDDAEEIIQFSITRVDDPLLTPLGEATLTANLSRDSHVLGESYRIPLNTPFMAEAGVRYRFKVEAFKGPILVAGSVVLTEGDWDDRLTTVRVCQREGMEQYSNLPAGAFRIEECAVIEPWYGLVHSYDLALSYPVDEPLKEQSFINGLEVGDYITITSNRFYDTVTRNPLRWPQSTRYYEALFSGELGFDLVATFHRHYELGPLSVSDQHLPIYESPRWMNEYEADEAFHVYDHPVVFVFQKRPDYDHQRATAILTSVSTTRIEQLFAQPGEFGEQLLGVVYWTSLQADEARLGLMQPPDILAINTAGGTWAERFNRESLLNTNQIAGALAWWLVMMFYGWVVWPLLARVFPRLPDRGYGIAKVVGLLLVAWIAWTGASIQLPLWNQGGIAFTLGALALLSIALSWSQRRSLWAWVRENRNQILLIEGLSFALFIAFIGVRLTNPDLWHSYKGGEKPMDFAYFNAILRSTIFPAIDPWFADGYLNYYYFGFVLVGSPVLLLQIVPSFAYNLIIPTLFAVTGIGAFSAAFNITASWNNTGADTHARKQHRSANPYAAGIMALLLCVVLGNLDTIRVLGNGLARLGGYQTPLGIQDYFQRQYMERYAISQDGVLVLPFERELELSARITAPSVFDHIEYELANSTALVRGLVSGTVAALGGSPLPIGSDRWYWGPSRVLAETPGVEGNAITEMPYFTFLYGDLHAHMINLPVLLLVIIFVFHEVRQAETAQRDRISQFLAVAIGAVAVGLINAINTWDWPGFLLFSVIGLGYAWWLRWRTINRTSLLDMLFYIGGFLLLSRAAALPYTTYYAATYGSLQLWDGGKTPIWAYFDIHGLFLFLIFSLLVWDTARWFRTIRMSNLRGQANVALIMLLMGLLAALLIMGLSLMGYQVVLIAVPLILWMIPLFFRRGQSREMQFVIVVTGLALAMTLGVEFIVLSGDIGRQNTVFKFYMQAWILLSVAGGAAFAWVLCNIDSWSGWLRYLWSLPLAVLFGIALMFPVMATRGRAMDRMVPDLPITLDGMDYMQRTEHVLLDYGVPISLADDYTIIRWMQDNVQGSPVIMEGRSAASEYRWNGRIAIYTGLPSVLGWRFHQTQQRTFDPLPRLVNQREENIKTFYNTESLEAAVRMLRHYRVQYVVVSTMERTITTPEGLAKFQDMASMGLLRVAYQVGESILYEVDQAALTAWSLQQSAALSDL